MILVKAWPVFTSALTRTRPKYPPTNEAKTREAARQIEFPLAAFLSAAGVHAHFGYTWWYRSEDGALLWHPEYGKRLGRPKGPAVRGRQAAREFEHASVDVDLAAGSGRVDWK